MAVDRAAARLDAAIARAEAIGNPEAWLTAVQAKYKRDIDRGANPQERAGLRVEIVSHMESLRARFRSRAGRLWVAETVEELSGILLRDGVETHTLDAPGVLELSEISRARTLLDMMSGGFVEPAQSEGAVRELEKRILQFDPRDDENEVSEEISLLSRLPLRDADTVADLEHRYQAGGFGFGHVAKVATAKEIAAELSPNEALIEYVIPDHPTHPAIALWAVVVTREEIRLVSCPVASLGENMGFIGSLRVDGHELMDVSPLGGVVLGVRRAIAEGQRGDANARLRGLASLVLDPLLEHASFVAEKQRWIIIPNRVLHAVPWGALIDPDNRPLSGRHGIVVAPSASTWLHLRRKRRTPIKTFVGFADPVTSEDPLPQTRQEVGDIIAILEAQNVQCAPPLFGEAASESAFREQAPAASMIHIATHGAYPRQDAIDLHQFQLSPSGNHDGLMHAEEIRLLDLKRAWMVVLSLCDGSIYRFGSGDEPYGLVPALLTAGAEHVVGALWAIEDQAARRLIVEFYRNLGTGSLGESMSYAIGQVLGKDTHPRDWASHLVIGSGIALARPAGAHDRS